MIWKALSDPTRRSILDLLREAPKTTGDLSAQFEGLSRYAIMKHLGILEKANLITIKREGKFRWNYLSPQPIEKLYTQWVKKYETLWVSNITQFKRYTEVITEDKKTMDKRLSSTVVAIELSINASVEKVWNALTEETANWWTKDFYTSPKTKRFVIEAKLGGLMYEDAGNNEGLVWAIIIGVNAPESILLKGHLSPSFGGPAVSFLEINLAANANGTTFKLTDSIMGDISDQLRTSLKEGWEKVFNGLKSYCED